MSPSEVHAALKRLRFARLLHGPELGGKPNNSALEEFLLHGLKYVFPAEYGQVVRGVPTFFSGPTFEKRNIIRETDFAASVALAEEGDTLGVSVWNRFIKVLPAPRCATLHSIFELLALVDAIRRRDGHVSAKSAERHLVRKARKRFIAEA